MALAVGLSDDREAHQHLPVLLPGRVVTVPQRIQRKRAKGWRMPEGAVYVGRPTIFGNPFLVGVTFCGPTIKTLPNVDAVVQQFSHWLSLDTLDHRCWDNLLVVAHVRLKAALAGGALRNRDLACWCPLWQPCHADVLLELANSDVS